MTDYYRVRRSRIATGHGVDAQPGDVIQPSDVLLSAFGDNLEAEPDASGVSLSAVEDGEATLDDVVPAFADELDVVTVDTDADADSESESDSTADGDQETTLNAETDTEEQSTDHPTADSEETDADVSAEDVSTDEGSASTPAPEDVVPDDYDTLTVGEVEEWAESADLSAKEVKAAIEYEQANADRVTAVEALEEEL